MATTKQPVVTPNVGPVAPADALEQDGESGPVFQGNPGDDTDKPDFSLPHVTQRIPTDAVEVPEGFSVTTADGLYTVTHLESGETFRVHNPDDIDTVLDDLGYE